MLSMAPPDSPQTDPRSAPYAILARVVSPRVSAGCHLGVLSRLLFGVPPGTPGRITWGIPSRGFPDGAWGPYNFLQAEGRGNAEETKMKSLESLKSPSSIEPDSQTCAQRDALRVALRIRGGIDVAKETRGGVGWGRWGEVAFCFADRGGLRRHVTYYKYTTSAQRDAMRVAGWGRC